MHSITMFNVCFDASFSEHAIILSTSHYRIGDMHASINPTTLGTSDPSIYICIYVYTTSTAAL